MTQAEIERISELAVEVARRASGFAARGSAIFNGLILSEELLGIAIKIRNLAPATLSETNGEPGT